MRARTRHLAYLRQLGGADDRDIDIAQAALALAALDLPDTEIGPYRCHVEALATGVAEAAPGAADLGAQIAAVHRSLFVRHAYRGDTESYDDVQNANLFRVIDRRRGLPVALGILCIHAARAQGWEIAGLNFPAHFLLRITASEGSAVVDPFDGARILEADDLGRLYADIVGESGSFDPERIPVMGNRDVLLRLQNNIKLRALRDGRAERAIEVLESMAAIAPAIGRLWWELAALLVQSGRLKRAIETLDAALERAGTPAARAEIESLLRRTRDSLN
ncbi:MAG TPA: transglutaminase-like domain-containing protein [Rhodospirillales bacterium]|nr:transglutaminase-like domain-containing protein [Rhodospirillales bacterium]HJO69009.1 transglutaminase-like domain-containing protein [Rhodospirillales bacterium]